MKQRKKTLYPKDASIIVDKVIFTNTFKYTYSALNVSKKLFFPFTAKIIAMLRGK